MRIGFSLGSLLSINDIVECTKILSNHKPDSIWVPETWGMDCGPMLSAISQIATRPKVGSSIINIYSRTPSLIAMNAATLDAISGGRLILGLGTSSKAIVENWHGLEFNHPLSRMREYVEIIRKILMGGKVNHDGRFFHLRDFSMLIKPVRQKIPIYIAAINPKMTELAWEISDGVIFYLRPLNEMRKTIAARKGRKKIDVSCQLITCVSNDVEMAITRTKKTIAFYVSVGSIYRDFLSKNGFESEIRAIYEEYCKSGFGETYKFVSDKMMNSLAISGTADEIPKKLECFARAGVDLPILQFNPAGNVEESFKLLVSAIKEYV